MNISEANAYDLFSIVQSVGGASPSVQMQAVSSKQKAPPNDHYASELSIAAGIKDNAAFASYSANGKVSGGNGSGTNINTTA